MVQHAVGFVLIPVANATDAICSLSLVTTRQGGCRSHLLAASRDAPSESFELKVADDCAEELLQKAGRVIHGQKLPYELRLLPAPTASTAPPAVAAGQNASEPLATADSLAAAEPSTSAAAAAAPASHCIQLIVGLQNMLLQGIGWRSSTAAAAALLFKQLLPMDTAIDAALQQALPGSTAAAQQQQQQQGSADSSGPEPGRYTLLSCFREFPSVSTAPPPMAISIAKHAAAHTSLQHQDQDQVDLDHVDPDRVDPDHVDSDHLDPDHADPHHVDPDQMEHQHKQQQQAAEEEGPAATARSQPIISSCTSSCTSSSSGSSSLGDVPDEVMQQLLGLLSSRDLASLACCCKGLRSVTWEAVPGLKLMLYPHQRNALSWMLHREVHGGQVMSHPYIVEYVTSSGVPVYLDQVTGQLSADPPPTIHDIRGGFFCDEPGLGKTVTALSLILKTQGTTPSPPPAAHVTWLNTPDGRKVGFYTIGGPDQGVSLHAGVTEPQQQPDLAAAAAVQGNSDCPNLGESGGIRRSGSYAGTGSRVNSLAGHYHRRSSSSSISRRQGAWALAPSLRSSSSRRRARSEVAAAEVAAAAAAEQEGKASGGSGSSKKRKKAEPGLAGVVSNTQGSSDTARAANIEVVEAISVQGTAPAAAAAASQGCIIAAAPVAAAAAAGLAAQAATPGKPLHSVPVEPTALPATGNAPKPQGLDSMAAAAAAAGGQQQQRDQSAVAGSAVGSPQQMLHRSFSPSIREPTGTPNQQIMQQQQQQQHSYGLAAAAGAGSSKVGTAVVQSWLPRRRAAVKAVSNIQQIYESAEQSTDDSDSPDHQPAAAAAGSSRAGSQPSRLASKTRISHDGSVTSDDVSSDDVSDHDESSSDLSDNNDSDSGSDYTDGRKQNLRRSTKQTNNSRGKGTDCFQQDARKLAVKQQQQQQAKKSSSLRLAVTPAQKAPVTGAVAGKPTAKRQKLLHQRSAAGLCKRAYSPSPPPQQQQQPGERHGHASDSEDSAAAAATDDDDDDSHDGNWVMCDHCSKWRTLPPGHKVDSNTPWFCCLHPSPDLASCLIPEEQHDGNNTSHFRDRDGSLKYSYRSMPGFIPLEQQQSPAAAAAAASEANIAHFAAAISQAADWGDPGWVQQFLWWLAGQSPEVFVTEGVTVPREVVKSLPAYGRILSLMSLQLKGAAAAAKKKGSSSSSKRPRSAPRSATPGTAGAAAAAGGGGSQAGQQQQQQGLDNSGTPGSQKTPSPAAAADPRSQDLSDQDLDHDPAPNSTAAATPAAAAARSSRKRTSSSTGKYSAAAHTWIQPPACDELRFDVAALRIALDQGSGTGSGAKPRMYLSSATLVIVPVTLIPHWQQQIRQHLLPRRLRVIVLGSATALAAGTDPAAAAAGGSSRASSSRKASSSTAAGGGGAAETVCPPAHELAWNYDVVITTFNRLSSDWSLRSDPRLAERMVLLKVHWLRVLIDEGHSLGASLGLTNKLAMAVQLTAQRRWVMTGTPTPATAAGSGAAHLQPLLSFIHHQPFGTVRSSWDGAVAKPLEAAAAGSAGSSGRGLGPGASVLVAEWGRRQLLKLLGRVMIRSCKSDLALLPPCYKKVTLLDFGSDHAHSYNALIEVIRRNLLLADWCDDAHKESLLNPKQGRWAKEMLNNVRLACCVAGATNLVPKEEDVLETLELLAGKLELPKPASEQHVVPVSTPPPLPPTTTSPPPAAAAAAAAGEAQHDPGAQPGSSASAQAAVAVHHQQQQAVAAAADVGSGVVLRQRWFFTGPGHPLHMVEEGLRNGCKCQVCGDVTHLPMVTPCAHLLCTDCTAVSRTECPVPSCGHTYDMQAINDPARYKNNPDPKWQVPLDLIEWQPVYHQIGATGLSGGQWSANWRITRSTKVLHLIRRLAEVGIYAPHAHHTAATTALPSSSAAAAAAAAGQSSSSPSFTNTKSCLKESTVNPTSAHAASKAGDHQPVVKAIVFSQFWMHIQLIAAELMARGVPHVFLKRDMHARDKQAAVTAFRASNKSSCLVMDESGALGLDLSFVRYIFLMEPIADAALEQQVVSRAHRMGATAAVQVEVLAMRHTAEEHLVALRHQAAAGKLNNAAVNEAASHAAAAVAGTTQQQQPLPDLQQQQQQEEEEVEELGGSSAAAAAIDLTNISNFISVGGAGNQMDSRGLRNLLLLHLRKVVVADLPEFLDHLEDSSHEAAAARSGDFDGQQIGWRGGRGNLLQAGGSSTRATAAAAARDTAAAAAGAAPGGSVLQAGGSGIAAGSMWGDFAVQQQQQQQRRSEPLDIGEDYDELPNPSAPQQQQVARLAAVNSDQQQQQQQDLAAAGPTHRQPPQLQQQQQQQSVKGSVQFADQQGAPDPQVDAAAAGAEGTIPLPAGGIFPAAVQNPGPATSAAGEQGVVRLKPLKRARFADDA